MIRISILLLLITTSFFESNAQYITEGPLFKKITSDSTIVFLRVPNHQFVTMEISTDSVFSSSAWFETNLLELKMFSVDLSLDRLKPNTKYFYRFYADELLDSLRGSFQTLREKEKP